MTAPRTRPRPAPKSTAAVATEVLAEHADDGDRGWLVFDPVDTPDGHRWATQFGGVPFVSMVKVAPVSPGFRCPVCAAHFFHGDVVCPELGEHPATKVVSVSI